MDAEFDALRALSAIAGADPLLVQAAGGNTSLKDGRVMRIKASGTWLAHALDRDIFVAVDLTRLRAALARGDADCETPHIFAAEDHPSGLRPSIETTVHALMPQRVVVHVHCVETISWAVLQDAETRLAQPLQPFGWAFVPYARPGLPLARAIQARLKPGTEVLVLGNHGLVVAADTVAEATRLMARVGASLRRPARAAGPVPLAALEQAIQGLPYRLPATSRCHVLALDPASLAAARQGTLYPDHVVFLGPGIRETAEAEPRLVVLPGLGVALHKQASAAAEAMALCLADVAARLQPAEPLRVLSRAEEDELVNWDAEKYRQSLERASAAASSAGLMRG